MMPRFHGSDTPAPDDAIEVFVESDEDGSAGIILNNGDKELRILTLDQSGCIVKLFLDPVAAKEFGIVLNEFHEINTVEAV